MHHSAFAHQMTLQLSLKLFYIETVLHCNFLSADWLQVGQVIYQSMEAIAVAGMHCLMD